MNDCFKAGILVLLLSLSSGALASAMKFDSYRELQKNLLSLMENAKLRLWYASRWLADEEIAEQVSQANHRHVDVRMLLGTWTEDGVEGPKILMFLSDRSVPFFLSPTLRKETITAILVDDRLVWVNAILGEPQQAATLFLKTAEASEKTKSYIAFFRKHYKADQAEKEWQTVPETYSYEKNKAKETPHVIKKLPKTVKWSEKSKGIQ